MAAPEPKYRWANAYEWFSDKIDQWTHDELKYAVRQLYGKLDGDDIQQEFQPEMVEDGYFKNLNKPDEEDEE